MNRPNLVIRALARLLRPVIVEVLAQLNVDPGHIRRMKRGGMFYVPVTAARHRDRQLNETELNEVLRQLRQASLEAARFEERLRDRIQRQLATRGPQQ